MVNLPVRIEKKYIAAVADYLYFIIIFLLCWTHWTTPHHINPTHRVPVKGNWQRTGLQWKLR